MIGKKLAVDPKTIEEKLFTTNTLGLKYSQSVGYYGRSFLKVVKSFFIPDTSDYDKRMFTVVGFRLVTSFVLLLVMAKTMQVFWDIPNFMLLLSLGSILPFFYSMFSVMRIIACPRMAAMVSNSALIGAFVALLLVAWLVYGNAWVTYVYLMSIWPWLAIGTVLGRLHIGRDRDVTQLSPLLHYPILAALGCGSLIGMLMALKNMTVIDCIVLAAMDPVFSAIFNVALINRTSYFERYMREFTVIVLLVFLYIYAQTYTGGVVRAYLDSVTFVSGQGVLSTSSYILFLGSRAAGLLRCCYIKKSFIPGEKKDKKEFKSLFPNFPFPIRFRLDVIFDSGLAEDSVHAVGPTGTTDLFMLTDNLYMLPLSSLACWYFENSRDGTLVNGFNASDSVGGAPSTALVWVVLGIFVLAVALTPVATSKILFDRGSSTHSWSLMPLLIFLPYVAIDLLYLNPYISRFQIVCLLLLFTVLINYRTALWLEFKRKYYMTSMKELEFLQPSCMRTLQKMTLVDTLKKSGVEDFGTLLLETTIHHGNNIRGYLQKSERVKAWDPKPSATAAWKLAGSLVIRAIRTRKARLNLDKKIKKDTTHYMSRVVDALISASAVREVQKRIYFINFNVQFKNPIATNIYMLLSFLHLGLSRARCNIYRFRRIR